MTLPDVKEEKKSQSPSGVFGSARDYREALDGYRFNAIFQMGRLNKENVSWGIDSNGNVMTDTKISLRMSLKFDPETLSVKLKSGKMEKEDSPALKAIYRKVKVILTQLCDETLSQEVRVDNSDIINMHYISNYKPSLPVLFLSAYLIKDCPTLSFLEAIEQSCQAIEKRIRAYADNAREGFDEGTIAQCREFSIVRNPIRLFAVEGNPSALSWVFTLFENDSGNDVRVQAFAAVIKSIGG
jgi:hypothetical protein